MPRVQYHGLAETEQKETRGRPVRNTGRDNDRHRQRETRDTAQRVTTDTDRDRKSIRSRRLCSSSMGRNLCFRTTPWRGLAPQAQLAEKLYCPAPLQGRSVAAELHAEGLAALALMVLMLAGPVFMALAR